MAKIQNIQDYYNRDCFIWDSKVEFGSHEAWEVNIWKAKKITIPASISLDIWSLKTQIRVEHVHFSLQLLNK